MLSLSRAWSRLVARTPRNRRPATPSARPRLEVLEDRRVLSAPSLAYATYLPTKTYASAVDGAGEAFLAGTVNGSGNATVIRLNASGSAAAYSVTLGSGLATGIAVDGAGDAYVTGYTSSATFPTTPGAAFQAGAAFANGNSQAGFLTELGPTGSIVYSTYVPGAGGLASVAVDGAGNAYLTGGAGAGLPTTAGAFQPSRPGAATTAYLAEFNPNLSGSASLLYCTYLGGTGGDGGTGIAVDGAGNAYLTGTTSSTDFPTTTGVYQPRSAGGQDVFVARINPALSGAASLVYSTYLGGSGYDGVSVTGLYASGQGTYLFQYNGPGIAVDGSGCAYVTGTTRSANFPVTPGAYQTSSGIASTTSGVGFVTKFNATGSGLVYSTFLGKATNVGTPSWARDTQATRIAVDAAGDAYVTGMTPSTSFPLVNPIQSRYGGGADAYVSTLNASGSGLLFSTYLGGSGSDIGLGIGLDAANNVYVAGVTMSTNFPITPGAYDTTPHFYGGFAAEITAVPTSQFTLSGSPTTVTAGVPGTLTVTARDTNGNVLTGYAGTVHFTSSDPRATLPADYTFTAADLGVHTFAVTLVTAGSQSITAADVASGFAGTVTGIAVQPAAAAQFVLVEAAPVRRGTTFSVTLVVEDAYGNVATGYTGTVHFSSSDSTGTLPQDYTFTAADAGTHTFGSVILRKRGTQSISVTDTLNSGLTATDTITVT
jgi:hypothetical protein